jgi:hypothetical protein
MHGYSILAFCVASLSSSLFFLHSLVLAVSMSHNSNYFIFEPCFSTTGRLTLLVVSLVILSSHLDTVSVVSDNKSVP